ncbi:amino acid racemase [Virgibacillus halodenitrificans]|uniref:aspartate/glutamate racemase family protein n=1 Tax=Virgibacillus halodenitrificans TaxID=1482 RepID=UPI001368A92C|nr:aspartate/glutamate racemase family protein [Virgibacillus halodenitrificans]MCG1029652.1 aspartate/glutamate racemase family protein [Virgibacillus halodenitrificans]MYL47244.1 amino acid racemase [Virgibacillus halodenitrificans]
MKRIGLLGGMSWESTSEYYRLINQEIQRRLGGLHSAECLLISVNFAEIERYQSLNEWEKAAEVLGDAAMRLEMAGAEFIVICSNTMHKVAQEVEKFIRIPILHIAEATVTRIKQQGIENIGLLGTAYTMEQDFYKGILESQGLRIMTPGQTDREKINQIIFEQLCLGQLLPESRAFFHEVIEKLKEQGAEGIILGCTEIGLLVKQEKVCLPVFDTTSIHAVEAVKISLGEEATKIE